MGVLGDDSGMVIGMFIAGLFIRMTGKIV